MQCQHNDADDIPEFLCRRCHPELNKTEWKPPTKSMQDGAAPDASPRDRYGRQLARGIEPERLAALLAEQDIEIAAKKASDEVRFKEMRAETAELKAAGIKVPRRVRRK